MKVKSKKLKDKARKMIGFNLPRFTPTFLFCLFTFAFLLMPSVASAQDDDDPVPPPLKLITKEERTLLDGENSLTARTKLVIELMRSNIDAAEKLNAASDFDGVFRELGHFRALVDYSLEFLQKQDMDKGKSLDNYKRLELSLRSILPRIESIRRELPLRYEDYVRSLLNYVRESRSKAIEPLFSETVLPPGKKNSEK